MRELRDAVKVGDVKVKHLGPGSPCPACRIMAPMQAAPPPMPADAEGLQAAITAAIVQGGALGYALGAATGIAHAAVYGGATCEYLRFFCEEHWATCQVAMAPMIASESVPADARARLARLIEDTEALRAEDAEERN